MKVFIRVSFSDDEGTQVDKSFETECSGPEVMYVAMPGLKETAAKVINLAFLDFVGKDWVLDFEESLEEDGPAPPARPIAAKGIPATISYNFKGAE